VDLDTKELGAKDLESTVWFKTTDRLSMDNWLRDLNLRVVLQDDEFLARERKRLKEAVALSDDSEISSGIDDPNENWDAYDEFADDTSEMESDDE
jgi:hypothetical protein